MPLAGITQEWGITCLGQHCKHGIAVPGGAGGFAVRIMARKAGHTLGERVGIQFL